MNFSNEVKNEIISERIKNPCCRRAAISAFLRTAGSIETQGGKVGFSAQGDENVLEYFRSMIKSLYGGEPKIISEKPKERKKLVFIGDASLDALVDCEIVSIENDGIAVSLNVSEYITENDCCKKAFVKGAFLGSGSVTIPTIGSDKKTGYHLEFAFSKYKTAADFAFLLSELSLTPKTVERKDEFVVYFKSSDEIGDVLNIMGATNSYLSLLDLVVKKDVVNNTNRAINCEMSNMNKQVEASIKIREAIAAIDSVIGIDALGEPLATVARARISNPEASLQDLAESLGLSKSCLSHRLNKIKKIAQDL